jgi:hypothetical protein
MVKTILDQTKQCRNHIVDVEEIQDMRNVTGMIQKAPSQNFS